MELTTGKKKYNVTVYRLVNKVNGKCYVGSSTRYNKRTGTHFSMLKGNRHSNQNIQKDYNEYGREAFYSEELFYCSEIDRWDFEEQFFKRYNDLLYNIAKTANCPMSGRKHTSKTKEKFKRRPVVKGEKHYMFGKKLPKATGDKISKALRGRKHTPQTRRKMRETALKLDRHKDLEKSREKIIRPVIDDVGNVFSSITEAAKFYKGSAQAICDNLKGRSKKTRYGRTFKYLEKE